MKKPLFCSLMLVLAAAPADRVGACQYPPGDRVSCTWVPSVAVAKSMTPFDVQFTMLNYPAAPPYPPPFLDDLYFNVSLFGEVTMRTCIGSSNPGLSSLDPASYVVRLDEAWSPFADEPTSDSRAIHVTPLTPGDGYGFYGTVCAGTSSPPTVCQRFCNVSFCILAADDPLAVSFPTGHFLEPLQAVDAGGSLPFRLRVLRNGYTPGVPLTVRVIPENRSDPIDLFPLEPASIATGGWVVSGDDEVVDFDCHSHFPCFVGVDNVFHVTIHDGPSLVWDSRLSYPGGMGRAVVTRSPMARQELVEIRDDGGDGKLKVGEHGTIVLRLIARNPYFFAALDAASLETVLPAGLTVTGYTFHYHDNPMDAYTPSPAELAATGTASGTSGSFRADAASIDARFSADPGPPPPPVFRDLFEVDVELETPAAGFPAPVDLVFPGVVVKATASGLPKQETSGPLTVPVLAALPPNRTGALLASKGAGLDVDLSWADSPVDALHAAASSYRVYRSVSQAATGYVELGAVANGPAPRERLSDAGGLAPGLPNSSLHFYKVSAFNDSGDSGDVP